MFIGQSICCCRTRDRIGFDRTIAGWQYAYGCYAHGGIIQNLDLDVSRVYECKVVYAGLAGACGRAINFTPGQWGTIKDYIESGGRFVLATEYQGCLQDSVACNEFLDFIGSDIRWDGGIFDPIVLGELCVPIVSGAANISVGLGTIIRFAATAELSGGTNVFKAGISGVDMVQVQKLGRGFVFVIGDSNLLGAGCLSDNNCEFAKRIFEYEDAAII